MMMPAPIIVLLGTSSSGKTSVANILSQQIKSCVVMGYDLIFDDQTCRNRAAIEFFAQYDNEFKIQAMLTPLRKRFSDAEILDILRDETIQLNSGKIPLFAARCNPTLRNTVEQLQALKKFLENPSRTTFYKKLHIFIIKNLHKQMFESAVKNSVNGIYTILDLVPLTFANAKVIDWFNKFMAEQADSNIYQSYVALIHCPLIKLITRTQERNKHARENNLQDEDRCGLHTLHEYALLFSKSQSLKTTIDSFSHEIALQSARSARTVHYPCENKHVECEQLPILFGYESSTTNLNVARSVDCDKRYDSAKLSKEAIANQIQKAACNPDRKSQAAKKIQATWRRYQ